jgi:hypothetical protein
MRSNTHCPLCCCRERVRQVTELVLPLAELPSEEAAAITHAVAGRDLPKAGESALHAARPCSAWSVCASKAVF